MKEGLDMVKGALAMWVRGRGGLNTVCRNLKIIQPSERVMGRGRGR
jgi:hypothetical protein